MHHILELLDRTAGAQPRSAGFCDETTALTWQQAARWVYGVGTALDALPGGVLHRPVGVYMERGAAALTAMLGVLAAGGFYTVLDTAQPPERVRAILDKSLYDTGITPVYGQQLLTLSTCGTSYTNTDSRFALLAVRVEN